MIASESEAEPIFELAEEPSRAPATEVPAHPPDDAPIPAEVSPTHAATPASVEKAIEEVNGIVDTLRTTLDDMEEVLEMLEAFERQKNLDEREIESLRRALRQVHRPRDAGHHQHR
jgi:hypothetical protein